ncbi:MAG: hypothetical protein AUJ75_00190 [Candidatus Omnitrophica bacterium CG1_02_49_10]|nr:MAG: hypothetical protein AUJ75_00190 [Candidatus Omnitrophica bacterium CG1_02_49_10]
MGLKIAVTGKGGVGKTTFSALIVDYISNKHSKSVLAVDADPNSNLSEALGLDQPESISDIIEYTKKHLSDIPAGTTKERFLEYRVHQSIQESKDFDLMVMGRPHGLGCYCYVNNVLTDIMSNLIKDYDYLVVDNEAGMEHLSRRTLEEMDILFIVSDYSMVGIRSAVRISKLADEIGINVAKRYLIINKATGAADDLKDMAARNGLELGGAIKYNKGIAEISLKGRALIGEGSSGADGFSAEVYSLCDNLLVKSGV